MRTQYLLSHEKHRLSYVGERVGLVGCHPWQAPPPSPALIPTSMLLEWALAVGGTTSNGCTSGGCVHTTIVTGSRHEEGRIPCSLLQVFRSLNHMYNIILCLYMQHGYSVWNLQTYGQFVWLLNYYNTWCLRKNISSIKRNALETYLVKRELTFYLTV